MNHKFITINGLIFKQKPIEYSILHYNDKFILEEDESFRELDNLLVYVYDLFQNRFFCDKDEYYKNIVSLPMWIQYGGIDADFLLEKSYFEKIVQENNTVTINKMLLLNDIWNIINSIQNRIIEAKNLFIYFYKFLSDVELDDNSKDGIFWCSNQKTVPIYSTLENFFMKLYSILDLFTKLFYEYNSSYTDFTLYPKMKSKGILYGDKNKLDIVDKTNTIFDDSSEIKLLLNLRHDIIHNGSFEFQNKVFFIVKNNYIVEKYLLMMDHENGNIIKFKNRNRFFSQNLKMNQILPDLFINICKKIKKTVEVLLESE